MCTSVLPFCEEVCNLRTHTPRCFRRSSLKRRGLSVCILTVQHLVAAWRRQSPKSSQRCPALEPSVQGVHFLHRAVLLCPLSCVCFFCLAELGTPEAVLAAEAAAQREAALARAANATA